MNVRLAELRAAADRLFRNLEDTGREEFDVSDDYYWEMSQEELYDPPTAPKELTMLESPDVVEIQ